MAELKELLEMTGCRDAADLQDMANVGRSMMERMADVVQHGPLKGWAPADDPAEIVTDLANELDEARAEVARLTAENFQLAAGVCRWVTGNEHGNAYCGDTGKLL